MPILRKALLAALILALLYGGVLVVERLTTQELTSASHATSQETVFLMWNPRLLRGDGVCSVSLRNAQGQVIDSATIGTLDTAFNALQQYGQLGFQGEEITVSNIRSGELLHRFVIRDGRLQTVK